MLSFGVGTKVAAASVIEEDKVRNLSSDARAMPGTDIASGGTSLESASAILTRKYWRDEACMLNSLNLSLSPCLSVFLSLSVSLFLATNPNARIECSEMRRLTTVRRVRSLRFLYKDALRCLLAEDESCGAETTSALPRLLELNERNASKEITLEASSSTPNTATEQEPEQALLRMQEGLTLHLYSSSQAR